MTIGNALQAAVNGFAAGRNQRNDWEDRKTENARKKRRDEILEDQNRRAEEAHDMDLETSGILNTARRQSIRQTDQDWGDNQSMRGVLDEADKAAAAGVIQQRDPVQDAPALQPAVVSTSGRSDMSLGAIRPAVEAATSPALSVVRRSETQPEPVAPLPQAGRGHGMAEGAGQSSALGAIRQPAAKATPPAVQVMPNGQQISGGVIVPPPLNPDGSTTAPTPERPYEWGQPGKMTEDIDRAGTAAGRAIGETVSRAGEMIANQAIGTVQRVNAPVQALSRYATGEDHIGAPERVDLSGDGKRESMATPVAEGWGAIRAEKPAPKHAPAAAGDAASESAKAVSDSAAQVMDAVTESSPGMKAAADAIPASSLGVSKTAPMTEPQRQKAAKTYMQSYRDNGAPLVVRELMRQGRLEDAKGFEQWIKDSRAEEGMTAWGRGMFAALQGDADGAADAFMDAYNASGYFNDGMEVVKDKTALIRDEAGEVIGVTLTMRDLASGEETTQTDSIDGFIQKAAWITSPEKAFEASQARLASQQEMLLKAQEDQREAATDLVGKNYEKTIDLARDIFSKAQTASKEARDAALLSGNPDAVDPPMTWDEAFIEAQRLMNEGPTPPTDPAAQVTDVPIARRPQ